MGNMFTGHVMSGDIKNVHTVRTGIEYMAELAGWDVETGTPRRGTLEEVGLGWVAEELNL